MAGQDWRRKAQSPPNEKKKKTGKKKKKREKKKKVPGQSPRVPSKNAQSCLARSVASEMTEEIDGYKDDLERQVATLRDGLDRVGRTKEDKKSNVRGEKKKKAPRSLHTPRPTFLPSATDFAQHYSDHLLEPSLAYLLLTPQPLISSLEHWKPRHS